MDGVINVYKPSGMTSFTCVSKVRRAIGEKKAGHAGTLDPEASGVLPVCVGKGTKCVDEFLNMPKRFRMPTLIHQWLLLFIIHGIL